MTSNRIWPTALSIVLVFVLAFALAGGAVAEIIEGPDPVGANSNGDDEDDRERENLAGEASKGKGHGNADRRASESDAPIVVWAQNVGGDHDIAFGEPLGRNGRGRAEFLTSSPVNELDPRVFVDADSSVYVVWWEDASPQSVLYARRPAGSDLWDAPLVITQAGRRPDVVVVGEEVLIAFERDALAGGSELVVATLGPAGRSFEIVASGTNAAPLSPSLEVDSGRVLLQWQDREPLSSERIEGGWTRPSGGTPTGQP